MRARGIDFSKWAVDWVLPDGAPLDFAIHRTSYGLRKDEKYENHSRRMNQIEIRGAYHYYSTAVPWKEQVDFFLDLVLNNPYTDYSSIYWDMEQKYNDLNARSARETMEAIRYLKMGYQGQVGIYCNRNDYTVHLAPHVDKSILNGVPLWLAVPIEKIIYISEKNVLEGTREPPWGFWRGAIFVPLPRPKGLWDLWQYSWLGDPDLFGIKGKLGVDVDVYNGTVEEMRMWLKLDESQPPPPQPDCTAEYNQALETYKEKIIEVGEALKR